MAAGASLRHADSMSVVPKSQAAKVRPRAFELKAENMDGSQNTKPSNAGANPRPARHYETNVEDAISPGTMEFNKADLVTVLEFYSLLAGGHRDVSSSVPNSTLPITLRTETPVTKEEALYAISTLFEWQGFLPVRSADGSIKLEPITQPR